MTLIEIIKKFEKLAIDNSPAILTAIGVTGTVTAAFLTGKATFKAAEIIADEEYRQNPLPGNHPLETKEKFVLVWKAYIPAAGTVVLTVVCIIFANRIGTRRATALATAFTLSEKAFGEYKDKVVDKLGVAKEQKVRDEVAQERVNRHPVNEKDVIITGNGTVLCFDSYTGRYFKSDMETIKKAQNDVNYVILSDGDASLSSFYDKVGLPTTDFSEAVGWNTDKLLELDISTSMSEDGRPCISVGFVNAPIPKFYRNH